MVIPLNKETNHIEDQNVDTQRNTKHEITMIKTEYTNLMWGNNKVKDSKKYSKTNNKNYCVPRTHL